MDALFESASGFPTPGASIMTDIEAAGRGLLFWRSFTQWLGGMGIIVLFVALLPELGPGARHCGSRPLISAGSCSMFACVLRS